MAYDLEEQEQLDALKAWWKQYGNLVTWLLIIALAGYGAWTGWGFYQRNQLRQAGQLYEEVEKAVVAKDNAKIQRAAADMAQKFPRAIYAQMAALVAAKSAVDADDLNTAKLRLEWVAAHGNDEYRSIAKLRLAGVLLDQRALDEAINVLSGEFPAFFVGPVADRKGDILVAQNKIQEARAAYQLALEKTEADNPGRQLIQIKLDALGGSADKAA